MSSETDYATPSPRHARGRWGRYALRIYCALAFLFLIAPLIIVFPVSFSSSEYLQFPPPGLSLRWYRSYLGSAAWIDATLRSVQIGLATCAFALALGLPLAFGIVRSRMRVLALIDKLMLAPVIVPNMVISVSIYGLFASLKLIGNGFGVVLAHTLLALPYVTLTLCAGLRAIDASLERAAVGLGASRIQAVWRITLPQLRASLITAGTFAFIISFDELIIAMFLSGSQATLPKKMFENITFAIDPTIAAVSVLQITLIFALLMLSGAIGRNLQPPRGP